MKQATPFYPRVHLETTPVSAAAARAGGVMSTDTVAATGLAAGLRAVPSDGL